MKCKICDSSAQALARAKVLNKYDVQYVQCNNCGFIQTEEPYWLDQAYTNAITSSDLGLVGRNIHLARRSKTTLGVLFDRDAKFIDYGGGYGLFVRIMRDHGFNFYRYDKFCDNLFAKGFDSDPGGNGEYAAATAFEVFEHLADPISEIEKILSFSSSILFSTVLIPPANPKPGEWWYYGLEHGQHVALYTYQSLKQVAKRFGLHLYSNRSTLHLLTPKTISPLTFRFVSSHKFSYMLSPLIKRKSLLADDYYKVTGTAIV